VQSMVFGSHFDMRRLGRMDTKVLYKILKKKEFDTCLWKNNENKVPDMSEACDLYAD
ncbi:36529_t:CDS:1, partial [Gigaspora margarita]